MGKILIRGNSRISPNEIVYTSVPATKGDLLYVVPAPPPPVYKKENKFEWTSCISSRNNNIPDVDLSRRV